MKDVEGLLDNCTILLDVQVRIWDDCSTILCWKSMKSLSKLCQVSLTAPLKWQENETYLRYEVRVGDVNRKKQMVGWSRLAPHHKNQENLGWWKPGGWYLVSICWVLSFACKIQKLSCIGVKNHLTYISCRPLASDSMVPECFFCELFACSNLHCLYPHRNVLRKKT